MFNKLVNLIMSQFISDVFHAELQKASLLENEMEVLCDSPACLKGVPVWNVSSCVETITAVAPTIENSHIPQSPSIKPHIDWSIIMSLIGKFS